MARESKTDECVVTVGTKKGRFGMWKEAVSEEIPKFQRSELVLGRTLGRGSFAIVRELKGMCLSDSSESSLSTGAAASTSSCSLEQDARSHSHDSEESLRNALATAVSGSACCVVKYLKESDRLSSLQIRRGRSDLALEADILKSLNHAHVVKLRGLLDSNDPLDESSFLIVDRLWETLDQRMATSWCERAILALSNGPIPGLRSHGSIDTCIRMEADLLAERLHVAYQLASALQYVHSKRIVYRDIKPENVGFDSFGEVKLIDFGLAKRLTPELACFYHAEDNKKETCYLLTARTGTLPYMAPEVAKRIPYNQKCDVYSFALLLWEMLALEPAFQGICSRRDFYFRVCVASERPTIHPSWPAGVHQLLRSSWRDTSSTRPSFRRIRAMLRAELRNLLIPHVVSQE